MRMSLVSLYIFVKQGDQRVEKQTFEDVPGVGQKMFFQEQRRLKMRRWRCVSCVSGWILYLKQRIRSF